MSECCQCSVNISTPTSVKPNTARCHPSYFTHRGSQRWFQHFVIGVTLVNVENLPPNHARCRAAHQVLDEHTTAGGNTRAWHMWTPVGAHPNSSLHTRTHSPMLTLPLCAHDAGNLPATESHHIRQATPPRRSQLLGTSTPTPSQVPTSGPKLPGPADICMQPHYCVAACAEGIALSRHGISRPSLHVSLQITLQAQVLCHQWPLLTVLTAHAPHAHKTRTLSAWRICMRDMPAAEHHNPRPLPDAAHSTTQLAPALK